MNLAVAGKSSHCQPTVSCAKHTHTHRIHPLQSRRGITVHLAIFRGRSPVFVVFGLFVLKQPISNGGHHEADWLTVVVASRQVGNSRQQQQLSWGQFDAGF